MQLIQLLQRLSPGERRELLERRSLDAALRKDLPALAGQLAHPYALQATMAELDAFQLLLLRWLAAHPGHEVSWRGLLDALAGRVPDEYLLREVKELRLWGLADYEANPRSGFAATYSAVASNLPRRRVPPLGDLLAARNSDDLRQMAMALGLRKPPVAKEDRLRLIRDCLGDRAFLQALLGRLSGPARGLFEWVRAQGGRVSPEQMAANPVAPSPKRRSSWDLGPAHQGPLEELLATGLVVGLTTYAYGPIEAYAVPEEAEEALSGVSLFDRGPLTPPVLRQADGVVGGVPSPGHLVRDVGHLLGFVLAGRCEFKLDGEPYQRSLQALGKALQTEGGYPDLLWTLAVASGVLRRGRGREGLWTVAEDGLRAPAPLYRILMNGWSHRGSYEGRLPPGAPAPRTRRERLLDLAVSLPADTWVTRRSFEELLAYLRPLQFDPNQRAGVQAEPQADWPALAHLALAQGQTGDGEPALMVPAGILALLRAEAHSEGAMPPWEERCTVQADRSVVAPPNAHPQALIDLWQMADLEENRGASVFRLSAASVARALNRGSTPQAAVQLLEKRSAVPLPDTVARLIGDQGQRYGRIRVGPAQAYVQTDDPVLLAELLRHRKLGGLELRELAPGVACVVNAAPSTVLDALRRAGYLPVLAGGRGGRKDRPAPSDRGATPRRLASLCRLAAAQGLHLAVKWAEVGRTRRAVLEPEEVKAGLLYAFDPAKEEPVVLQIDSVLEASLAPRSAAEAE